MSVLLGAKVSAAYIGEGFARISFELKLGINKSRIDTLVSHGYKALNGRSLSDSEVCAYSEAVCESGCFGLSLFWLF